MSFDPSARGPFSVASRSGVAIDRARDDRALPFEVWHPVDGDGGPHPIVLYSHASGGGRRQSSFLCEHLASHGYVVAAADHVGNTAADFAASAARAAADAQSTTAEREASLRRIISDRVPDLRFILDRILGGAAGDARIDHERIGIVGWSFGGWAALEVDERFRALVALAPAGNSKPLPGIIPATLTFRWKREVHTLDPRSGARPIHTARWHLRTPRADALPQAAVHPSWRRPRALRRRHRRTRRLFARGRASVHAIARARAHGCGAADNGAAREFLADDPVAMLRSRGVDATEYAKA